jgi:hypothetical protein
MLGAAGYAFGLYGRDRTSRILGVVAIVLCALSMILSGLIASPQQRARPARLPDEVQTTLAPGPSSGG